MQGVNFTVRDKKKPQADYNEAQCSNHLGITLMTSDGLCQVIEQKFSFLICTKRHAEPWGNVGQWEPNIRETSVVLRDRSFIDSIPIALFYQCLGQGQMLTRCAISSFVGLHRGLRPWRAETLISALTLSSFLIRGNVLNLYLTPFPYIFKNDSAQLET